LLVVLRPGIAGSVSGVIRADNCDLS
jgi:hypothetical protein